ncbi:MAG: ATP-dependent DNA helicase II subunit 1 [Thelocarpon superellum]|nr:MAG: ATP-dependent DNA helicase II subunit 1 [Thelocarpon superellum]
MADSDSWLHRDDEDGDAEDEAADGLGYKTVKDAVLFAIEVSPSMLTVAPSSEAKKAKDVSPTLAALSCAYHLMQQRIISHPNDLMGILLFGTEQSRSREAGEESRGNVAYPHCYLLTDLDVPAADDVKALKSIVEETATSHPALVPSTEAVSMANMLFCANQIFTNKAANFTSRRLFIITDNDNPHAADKALRSAAAVRAKDLYDLGVIIELFPISTPAHEFDPSNFYDDIIYRTPLNDPDAPRLAAAKASKTSDGITLLNSLLSSISSKAVPRRALFANLPLEIAPGLKISVKGHIIFKRQLPARSCYVWLDGEKAQIAKGTTLQTAGDTTRPVEKGEIRKAYKFGGEQVVFTPDEITSLRSFGDPVIRILGFKPMSALPIWASLKQSTFIYPSEEDFIGSTRVFSALHQKLLQDDKMGVAWFVARKNAAPVIAALVPGAEKLGEYGEQVMPPGLWLIPLPFEDDIRQNPETILVQSPDSLVDLMRTVIQQLQLPKAQYSPERYPNPALQWHYRILQAMALDEDIPEKPEDRTVPKYKQIDKRAGEYVLEWGRELEQQYRLWQKEHGSGRVGEKRALPIQEGGMLKRPKTTTSSESVNDEEMRRHFDRHAVDKLKVPALKAWLETKHMSIVGKKAELVERVEQWFEAKT